jgi:anti-anti-sigma factor
MRDSFDHRLRRSWGGETPSGPITRLMRTEDDGPARPFAAVSHESAPGAATIVLTGELDISSAAGVDQQLRHAEREARLVVLDLRRLDFIDSSGLHLIVDAHARIREAGGRLVVVRGPATVQRVFQIARLDEQLEIVDQPPAADRPRSDVIRCPSCREAIGPRDLSVEVNGCYVHLHCARDGVYQELPTPAWASREQETGGDDAA